MKARPSRQGGGGPGVLVAAGVASLAEFRTSSFQFVTAWRPEVRGSLAELADGFDFLCDFEASCFGGRVFLKDFPPLDLALRLSGS